MELAALIPKYRDSFKAQYSHYLLPSHRRAIDAISRCRTPSAGEVLTHCKKCNQFEWHPCSCGHRSCPKCQNHDATRWLERQRQKLLPVEYFLATFTLPAELRTLAWSNQRKAYDALFTAAIETIKAFGQNPKHLGAEMGCTAVLHTHNRRLGYHPHIHVVVPGGGVDKKNNQWKRTRGKYLFNEFAMAMVFRGKLLFELEKRGLKQPADLPKKWVMDCRHVGRGEPALEYLSRYLYRGVVSESEILFEKDGEITFRYTNWKTKTSRTETLPGPDFLWRVLQHVLPKGFHRVRDYGFLHHNARKTLRLIQLILQVGIKPPAKTARPPFFCSACGGETEILGVYPPEKVAILRIVYSVIREVMVG